MIFFLIKFYFKKTILFDVVDGQSATQFNNV